MKRKISILTLALLFFTANTALPFTMHICQMMDMTETCSHMIPKKDLCCEEENEGDVFLAKAYDQCCLSKIIDPSLKENYVGSKTELVQKPDIILYFNSMYLSTAPSQYLARYFSAFDKHK
jgi:hypothetical protein